MNEQFQAHPIDQHYAIAAYPLVFMHDASITTDQWLQFVRRHGRSSSPRTGLIAIRDRRGVIHALFSYRIDSDLRVRKRLSISDLIVAHLAGSQIDDAVADVIADVARQYGCQAVTIERPFVTSDMRGPGCPTAAALRRASRRIN
ncbi:MULTISPECIES: hypothetical protein [Bradyrhizobium]|jgi:hypothetical protein|uniref:hypothetical protein n=1 Tax=Bradyrhizobium TaxID=374 RepID=UPI00040B2C86|nr:MULTISPECIES: hypothetical protein [Bradyrhizobium]AUC98876.1 hypothetical protein CWS35_35010 [Bradyrhizobium sp. SK17]MBK5651419.1 hypothetical protein [Rhizobium sp.]OCX27959.1 hypothetical protein QU42_28975 [Bradyrhizobium sp. UASWS1016]